MSQVLAGRAMNLEDNSDFLYEVAWVLKSGIFFNGVSVESYSLRFNLCEPI